MKKFIITTLLTGCALFTCHAQQRTLTILHTNDTHSTILPLNKNLADTVVADRGGYLRRIALLKEERAQDPELLLFDSGDFSQGSAFYSMFEGDVELGLMNQMHYDAVTIGNHEFDFGLDNMIRIFKKATFPIVCSNYDFANTELKEDIERKEKTEEMRREFLSNVTHELKTPLALIRGYAEGLAEGVADDPESTKFYTEVIVDEADKMNRMVSRLLSLNQLEFGDTQFTMMRFDIVGFIRGCLASVEMLARQKEISVRLENRAPLYVWADEFWTEEVFINYFSNAVNHCEGEKVIDIHFEEKQNCVRVVVFNTGKPIPEEAVPHLWEKFYKVDKARTREYGGSGVGLSVVKAIMDQMQQDYGVINYVNGVSFWFELEKAGVVGADAEAANRED